MREHTSASRALEARLLDELPRISDFVRKLTRHSRIASEVDDIVQEVAARALRYRSSFDVERELAPWLHKTALRVFLDRRERARREPGSDSGSEAADRADHVQALADRDAVARLLGTLSKIEREVLTRFHMRGESVREIAEALSLPEGTIKSHLHRARNKLVGHDE